MTFRTVSLAIWLSVVSQAAVFAQASPGAGAGGAGREGGGEEDLLERAREAQRRFERLRVERSPMTWSWNSSGCDEILGRLCRRDDEGGDWWPEEEDSRIADARAGLLETLEDAAAVHPHDPWLMGQRVAYLEEEGRADEALAVATSCRTDPPRPGWCPSLMGLALHRLGRFEDAEQAFREALERMGGEERRRWTDPTELLDREGRHWFEDAEEEGEEAKEAALALLWFLSDPLHLVPGNDRLTEHWSRWTSAWIRRDAANPYGLSWGRDLEELLVRYGSEVGWERALPVMGAMSNAGGAIGHRHPRSRAFVPPGSVLRDPEAVAPPGWSIASPHPRTGYVPPYAPVVLPARGEVLLFPGDRHAAVVATYALPEDTTAHSAHDHSPFGPPDFVRARHRKAGLFLRPVDGSREESVAVRREGGGSGALLLEDVPAGSYAVRVEVWDPATGVAGRILEGLVVPDTPPDVPTLSDLVLLDTPLSADATLADAVGHIRTPDAFSPGERIVLGWEVHGLGWRPSDALTYRVTVSRTGGGLLKKVGAWLGLVNSDDAERLTWTEAGPAHPTDVFRSVALDLRGLDPGTYRLRVELESPGREALVRERSIVVAP